MKTTITETDGKYTVTLDGELDTACAQEFEEATKPIHNLTGKEVIIDCAKLEYIASSGLRTLLAILKNSKANGNKVVLKNLNDEVLDVFKMTGFINIFTIE